MQLTYLKIMLRQSRPYFGSTPQLLHRNYSSLDHSNYHYSWQSRIATVEGDTNHALPRLSYLHYSVLHQEVYTDEGSKVLILSYLC